VRFGTRDQQPSFSPHYPLADIATEDGERATASLRAEEQDEGGLGRRDPPDLVSFHRRLDTYYREAFTGQWRLCAISGAFSILAGIATLLLPVVRESEIFAYAGGILLVRGVLALVSLLSAPRFRGSAIIFLSAFLYLSGGIYLIRNVITEPISLIWFFAAYFISTGIAALLFAVSYRRKYSGPWEWLLIGGVLNLELALISLSRLPEHYIWILIIFLGLDFITHGSALLAVALSANDNSSRRAGA
jgi:uncharacterized membrane protein HdeD (DUF308 family)